MTAAQLPSPRELHELARSSRTGHTPPEAFTLGRGRLDEAAAEMSAATEAMHTMIRDAYELGVAVSVLARWSGYHYSNVQKIVGLR